MKQTKSHDNKIAIIFVGSIKANTGSYMVPHVHAIVACSPYVCVCAYSGTVE